MKCREKCGACCIAPSISSPVPGMPKGKPGGMRCIQLTEDLKCKIFGSASRPKVCSDLQPSEEMCGFKNEDAFSFLQELEAMTKPPASKQ